MNDELRQQIREEAESAQADGRMAELAPDMAIRVLDALEEAHAKYEELAALACGLRHYARRHHSAIGECVAWTVLKEVLGVGRSDEADDARWEAYQRRERTALRGYGKRRGRK